MNQQVESKRETVIDAVFKDAVRGFLSYIREHNLTLTDVKIERAFRLWDFKGFYSLKDWQEAIDQDIQATEIKQS